MRSLADPLDKPAVVGRWGAAVRFCSGLSRMTLVVSEGPLIAFVIVPPWLG